MNPLFIIHSLSHINIFTYTFKGLISHGTVLLKIKLIISYKISITDYNKFIRNRINNKKYQSFSFDQENASNALVFCLVLLYWPGFVIRRIK